MFLLFCSLIACNTHEKSAKDQVIVVNKHSAPQKDDFKKFAFSCCSDQTVQKTVESYVALTDALANDDATNSPVLGASFLEEANKQPSLKEESETIKRNRKRSRKR